MTIAGGIEVNELQLRRTRENRLYLGFCVIGADVGGGEIVASRKIEDEVDLARICAFINTKHGGDFSDMAYSEDLVRDFSTLSLEEMDKEYDTMKLDKYLLLGVPKMRKENIKLYCCMYRHGL